MYIPKSDRSQSQVQIFNTAFILLICFVEKHSSARLQVVVESAVRCSVSSSSALYNVNTICLSLVLSLELSSKAVVLVSSYPSPLTGNDLEMTEVTEDHNHEFNKQSQTAISWRIMLAMAYEEVKAQFWISSYNPFYMTTCFILNSWVKVRKGMQSNTYVESISCI